MHPRYHQLMRTTIDLDKQLLQRAKRLALSDGQTLSAVVNRALSAFLGSAKAPRKQPFELIVRGRAGGRFPSPADIAAAEEADEVAALGIAKRSRRATP